MSAGGAERWPMAELLGDDVAEALRALVLMAETLPGTFRSEFSLTYCAGVDGEAEAWSCTFEVDEDGDGGGEFVIVGQTAAEVLRRASDEVRLRVSPHAP